MGKINRIENEVILHGRRNNQAWFEPRIGVIPGDGKHKDSEVFIVTTLLTGNDIGPVFFLKTGDLGRTWTPPMLSQKWHKNPIDDDVFEEPWLGPTHHKKTGKLIAIGGTHFVRDKGTESSLKNEHHFSDPNLCNSIAYSVWSSDNNDFDAWKKLKMPKNLQLGVYYAGQRHECNDGTILIPGYYRSVSNKTSDSNYWNITVLRCSFDGSELQYIEHGSIHTVEEKRGLAEPSLIYFQGRYFMTIRHDLRGYVTTSFDGLHFDELKVWMFDDGTELGSYNTQQHWLKHNNMLYLVYTRKNELSNGVVRDRAPLFMAEVDSDTLQVRRATEQIVFPEKEARMGNFSVVNVTDNESWIITGEWLQGMFSHSKKGKRFWADSKSFNYIQYIGDLLLARVYWKN